MVLAIIVAAGKGTRMKSALPKPYLALADKPILARTIEVFEKSAAIDAIIVVTSPAYVQQCQTDIVAAYGLTKVIQVVAGGKERQHSVYNALLKAPVETDIVLIQDGVRPFVTDEMIDANIAECKQHGAVITAVPVKDTIKEIVDGMVQGTPERSRLWSVQTPQTFYYQLLLQAYTALLSTDAVVTDDASVVEHAGKKVAVTLGTYDNIKITTPEDIMIAEQILKGRA